MGFSIDAAIRENRQGKVRVAYECIVESGTALELLNSRMMVFDRNPDPVGRYQTWSGYSPDFELLVIGMEVPIYDVVIHCSDDGSRTVEFRRE